MRHELPSKATLLGLAVATSLLGLGGAALAEEPALVVVVNTANPTQTLSRGELSRLFLKRTTTWASGATVQPVDQPDETPIRARFCREVHQKTPAAVNAYWRQQIFSGREVPPVEKRNDAEVLAFVRDHAGAVGYVTAAAPADKVKVLSITE